MDESENEAGVMLKKTLVCEILNLKNKSEKDSRKFNFKI